MYFYGARCEVFYDSANISISVVHRHKQRLNMKYYFLQGFDLEDFESCNHSLQERFA